MSEPKKHPPVANKVVLVDFDGTLIAWGPLNQKNREVQPDDVDAMRELREAGYKVVIFTSRASRTWWEAEAPRRRTTPEAFGLKQLAYVKETLDAHGVPYDGITAEKVPAERYFDDMARRVSEAYPLCYAVEDFLNGTD